MFGKAIDAVVLARRALTGRIAEFCIGRADGRPLPMAESGSHVELYCSSGAQHFVRHYSMVGPLTLGDDPEPFWRIAVQREDRARGSAFIHDTFRVGTALKVSRPINAFRLARHQANTLLVAGGIGVTPMLAMVRSLRTRNVDFAMVYAGQQRSAMAYVSELEGLCGDRLTVHESKRDGIPDLVRLLSGQPAETMVYVCGPCAMIETLREAASALGWRKERVRYEVFNAAHRPDDGDFEVQLSTGRRVKVGAGMTILEALELAGLDTLSSCRRGECGLCITDVAGCDGELDHRDRYFSDEEHRAGRQIAICCSRITGRALALNV